MTLSELESKRGLKIRFRQDRQDPPLRKRHCLSANEYSAQPGQSEATIDLPDTLAKHTDTRIVTRVLSGQH